MNPPIPPRPAPRAAKTFSLRLSRVLFWLFLLLCAGAVGVFAIFAYYSKDLPSTEELKNYYPKTTTRLYDANGGLLAEFASERRVFVPIASIPESVKQAFISAEDQNFYKHSGVDVMGMSRALIQNVLTKLTGRGGISGGSTITQQVVKNLLLHDKERKLSRKIKEAILAIRVTQSMSKDKILEIYLNEIFLGNRSYGVVAAAYNYFNKSIDELTIEEAAMLAAMPKAPSDVDPRHNYDRAMERRNYVIDRMLHDGYINQEQAETAKAKPIKLASGVDKEIVSNNFAEEIRRFLVEKYGEEQAYGGGLTVRTTLNPKFQKYAEKALYDGITSYDRAHGWRGPIAKINNSELWHEELAAIKDPEKLGPWRLGAVLSVTDKSAEIGFKDGKTVTLPFEGAKWARQWLNGQRYGAMPSNMREILKPGYVVAISTSKDDKENVKYTLEQIPEVNGATMVMDPSSGRVLAMVGGYPYGASDFNRATQAKRQPGSSFKPIVYLAALENGFLPSTIVNDGPIAIPQGPGLPMWTPKNYGGDFLGPIPLRRALALSRNNVTVLISLMMGVNKVQEMARRLGVLDNPAPYYSMVLGADETTLMRLITAYAIIDRQGKSVKPILIDRIQDRAGRTIFKGDTRECVGCSGASMTNDVPKIMDNSKQLVDPATTYQLITMLQGVVQFGTAARANKLGRPLAGKTGTTNDSYDNWFMGFSPDIVVGTFIGFDKPKTLGRDSTGASTALPVFINFMTSAAKDIPVKPFPIPPGIRFQRIDTATGQPPTEGSNPANITMEIINPKAPPEINYSDEYKEKFLGGSGGLGGGSIDSGLY